MKNLQKILPAIEEELGKKVDLNKTFNDNDIDSLDSVSLLGLIEDEFKITLNSDDLLEVKDFKSLEKIIQKNLK